MSALVQPEPNAAEAIVAWSDRWFAWRNRLLASRVFQKRAAFFALTRPVARRRAGELFDLVAGFVYSQVLLACVRLNLFDILAEGPRTVASLARRLGLSEPAALRLLAAAHALRLAERRSGDRYGLGVLGATMVGNHALAAMVEHHTALYADLADPVALLRGESARTTHLSGYWAYASIGDPRTLPQSQVADYTALMSASQPLVAEEILDAYALEGHRCLLDVGGGEGSFLLSAAERAPHLRLMLFDLPSVSQKAAACFADAGLASRATAHGGDFRTDPLPRGADLATLVRVVHDHDDAGAGRLLAAIHEALEPGGVLLLAEPMAGTAGAEAMGDAYFGFYLLAMGSGQPRTPQRLTEMLVAAGFEQVRRLSTRVPLQTQILIARKKRAPPATGGVNLD
ncbi:methyltransferase [Ramlibacter sp.]|uniref:methyltransferase n=1 Tax=Ramlibacter sp. TaxID=1917967 RepID=UPI003D0BE3C9